MISYVLANNDQFAGIVWFWTEIVTLHSMAMGNLNKSKETTQTATTALKAAP